MKVLLIIILILILLMLFWLVWGQMCEEIYLKKIYEKMCEDPEPSKNTLVCKSDDGKEIDISKGVFFIPTDDEK